MKIDTIQTSFVGGEFAPSLFGRTDIAQYANALATLENFIVRPFGSVISCPGTEYIAECKTGGSTSIARLIQFIFSRQDAYIIEMGVGYFRFYTDGAVVVSTGTTPYEVAHTYEATDLADVQFCQINDVIYLAHKDYKPKTLTRLAAANWVLADMTFTGGPFQPDNTTSTLIRASGTAGSVTLSVSPTNVTLFTVSGSTMGHVNTYWRLGGTMTNSTTGLDEQGYVYITAVTNPSTATATVMKTLTAATTAGTGTNDWAEGSWSDVAGWPARVTFHQQRLFFARTDTEPQTIWGSKSYTYTDYALDGSNDDDALNLELASNESNDIKWIASGKPLIAGTYGGEYVVEAGDGAVLTPSNANAIKQTGWGSEAIIPKKIGNFFYYIQRFAKKIRELFYFWDLDTYKSVDKTILSPHITDDGIIEMAYQQNPDTVLWCVTSQGTLATMTREIDQDVSAWARQTTDGAYESIATIPSLDRAFDEIWVIVRRTIGGSTKRYIERFMSQELPDRQDQCWYVHSGLYYDAYTATSLAPTAATLTLPTSASVTGATVTVTCNTAYFAAADVGQRIRAIDTDGTTLGELKITGYTSSTVVVGEIRKAFASTTYSTGYWGLSVTDISGLDHLEGKEITVLADGGTSKPNQTVSSGSITLPYDAFYVVAGLGYTQLLKTLPQEAGSQRGTSQGKIQRINQVAFKVNRSHKGFYTGGALDTLDKVQFRDPSTLMGTPEQLYTGTIPNISFRSNYEYGAPLIISNEDPLPIELLAIITTLDTQDKT